MKRSYMLCVLVVAALTVGCSYTKGGSTTLPTDLSEAIGDVSHAGRLSPKDAAALAGGWEGSETATVGESGTLLVTFTTDTNATVSWTSATSSLTYTGSVTGSLAALSISAAGSKCSYDATATLSGDQNTITGSYTATGPGVCPTKKGNFTLTRKVRVVDLCPNIEGVQLTVPQGYQVVEGQCVVIPPPPVDVCPNLEGLQTTVPDGYQLQNGICVIIPPPPTCNELNPPTFDPPTLEKTNGNKVQGKVHKIHNTAVWTLKLYRNGNKVDEAEKTLKCKQDEDIDVSYAGDGHGSSNNPHPDPLAGDYVLKLYRDGTLVYTSPTLHIAS